jgi:hypothetical protein
MPEGVPTNFLTREPLIVGKSEQMATLASIGHPHIGFRAAKQNALPAQLAGA